MLLKITSKYAVLLAITALICTALSVAIHFLTKEKIDNAIAEQQIALLSQVISPNLYDNNLLESCYTLDKNQAKNTSITQICEAKKQEKTVAYAYETIAPDGYSGDIRFLVGLTPTGEVLGVRVLEHKETPGLGDKIELRISDWILSFNGQKISSHNQAEWAVKKDGGKFDQFAGATITPRAIINQIKHSALFILQEIHQLQPNKRLNEK